MSHNYAVREAFYSSTKGKAVVVSAKKAIARDNRVTILEAKRKSVGDRIRALKNLAYDTFMGTLIPRGVNRRADVYFSSKERIRELGRIGGSEYAHAMTSLKFAYQSWGESNGRGLGSSYRQAIEAILPPEFDTRKQKEEDAMIEVSNELRQELAAECDAFAGLHTEVESSDGLVRYEDVPESEMEETKAFFPAT
jgi:hypothetical protein